MALAFVTGLAAGRTSSSDARRPGRPSDFVNEPRPRAGQLVSTGNEATFAPGETAAGNQNAGRASSSRYEQTTLRVALQEPESGQTVPVEVPLVDVSEVGLAWPGPASALPLELRRRLEQTGHSIHETRHWVPVQLHDGRQVLLPVDHVQVELAETYQ
ncbi:MAG TPA: hypothetical protein VML55_01295 [Planctomycetaceae bacterium]|nr:hypothetical protein [Planctomycetaceae bacterium]